MFQKVFTINILLLAAVIFLGVKTYGVWVHKEEQPKRTRRVSNKPVKPPRESFKLKKMPRESKFASVVEKNLFTPERNAPEPEEPEPETEIAELPVPGKKIEVYGIVLGGGHDRALIKNPERKPDESPTVWVQVGDSIGDFKIAAIQKDRVILAEGTKRYEALLYDGAKKEKKRRPPAPAVQKSAKPKVVVTEPKQSTNKPPKPAQKKPAKGEWVIVDTPMGKMKQRVK